MEPIDYFYPLTARGCVEPCLDMETVRKTGRTELVSRQIIHNGKKCQKAYHRLLIRHKHPETPRGTRNDKTTTETLEDITTWITPRRSHNIQQLSFIF